MQTYDHFDYYPVSGYELKDAAEDTRTRVTSVSTLLDQLEQCHGDLLDGVEGELEGPAANAPTAAVTNANAVLAEAEYAASCLELFGTHVDVYDHSSTNPRSIDKLNAAYDDQLGDDFGATYTPAPAGSTQAEQDKAYDDYYTAYTTNRRQLLNGLNAELARLDTELNEDARAVGRLLDGGPTDANVQTLWSAGVLPPYAPILYPGAGLDGADLPPDAQVELVQYLIDHPDLLVNTPAALVAIISALPTEAQTTIEVERRMEQLRQAGHLTGPNPGGRYEEWIRNTVEGGVPAETVLEIAEDHDITPGSFDVLNGLQKINDPDGKSFFVLPSDITGDDAEAAVLMSYILNAGTDYEDGDFEPTPYSSAEIQRIKDRQDDNDWSYDDDVDFVHGNGGRLVTTPNGMLMGAGGNELQDVFGQQGGTTWGDIFMVGENDIDDPAAYLEQMIESGTSDVHPDLDLDQLLHHEERHSQQWAREGYTWFIAQYLWDADKFEEDAGLEDGGY